MQAAIQDPLDDLLSPRSSLDLQGRALHNLEKVVARALAEDADSDDGLELFLRLQDVFCCNVACRMMPWISHHSINLKKLAEAKRHDEDGEHELRTITLHIIQSLTLLQGIALLHSSSKDFLGRKYSINVFVDLLSIFRQANWKPSVKLSNSTSQREVPLASVVLDTLLCILVDSPSAIRTFEEADGVEVVVKLLKRAAIPRDVRMKCLEFLYFYLMDEGSSSLKRNPTPASPKKPATCPSSPTKLTARPTSPVKPTPSRLLPSKAVTPSMSSMSSSSGSSSGSVFSSFSSWSTNSTLAATPPISPSKPARSKLQERCGSRTPEPLAMLRRDVDFVPLSPKKVQIAHLGVGVARGVERRITPLKFRSGSDLQRERSALGRTDTEVTLLCDEEPECETFGTSGMQSRTRTTEEKKEILGQLLGNVDALVEGVKKAGIWGLGD